MGKKGKKAQAGRPRKLTPKDISKKLDALAKKLKEELEGADLFAPLPPTDDCVICLEPLSRHFAKESCQPCCGNQICRKCVERHNAFIEKQNEKNAGKANKKTMIRTCPFCREPKHQESDELIRRLMARASMNDHLAMTALGFFMLGGKYGLKKDEMAGYSYLIQAAELGSAEACTFIAIRYSEEYGFPPRNKERENLFIRIAAARGDIQARYFLGDYEYREMGNHELGVRHWKISAEAGDGDAFIALRDLVGTDKLVPGREFITKDELDKIRQVAGFEEEAMASAADD